jgi:hypothetical protein
VAASAAAQQGQQQALQHGAGLAGRQLRDVAEDGLRCCLQVLRQLVAHSGLHLVEQHDT